jgi:membrane protein implicated in regulation of membrane protease activity
MQLEAWQWIVGAVVMAMLELAIPAFVLIWFALGALLVALVLLVFPVMGLTWQLSIWLVASVAMVYFWFKVFKPNRYKTRIGTADANVIGEIGVLARAVEPFTKGEVRFQKPLLGTDTWPCIADSAIAMGKRVKVIAVEGSMLKVEQV